MYALEVMTLTMVNLNYVDVGIDTDIGRVGVLAPYECRQFLFRCLKLT